MEDFDCLTVHTSTVTSKGFLSDVSLRRFSCQKFQAA